MMASTFGASGWKMVSGTSSWEVTIFDLSAFRAAELSGLCVHVEVCMWRCACDGTHVRCACGGVHVEVCMWRCAVMVHMWRCACEVCM